MTSQDARVVSHELVAAIPVKGATLDGTDTNSPHELGGQLPKWRLALLIDVTVPWRSWAERAFPHMQRVAFPNGVSSLVDSHQARHFQLGASHVGDTKPPHFPIGLRKAAETGAIVQRLGSWTSSTLGIQRWKAQTWEAHLSATFLINLQNNCTTDSPTHPAIAVFFQTHFPTGVSIAHAFLSHAPNSNDHTDTHECHAHHTVDRGEG